MTDQKKNTDDLQNEKKTDLAPGISEEMIDEAEKRIHAEQEKKRGLEKRLGDMAKNLEPDHLTKWCDGQENRKSTGTLDAPPKSTPETESTQEPQVHLNPTERDSSNPIPEPRPMPEPRPITSPIPVPLSGRVSRPTPETRSTEPSGGILTVESVQEFAKKHGYTINVTPENFERVYNEIHSRVIHRRKCDESRDE